MKTKRKVWTIAIAAALATSGAIASAQENEPIKFGLCFDLSKSYTFISPQVAQAAQDLAMYTNENGGIEGHPAMSRSAVWNAMSSSNVRTFLYTTSCLRQSRTRLCRVPRRMETF